MKPLFIDTSGWYDLLSSGAPKHVEIVQLIRQPGAAFVTTAARAGSYIRSAPEVRVVHPDETEELRAWSPFLDRPDKAYTLTYCLSFVLMRGLAIDTAVATDHHFDQEGFTTLP